MSVITQNEKLDLLTLLSLFASYSLDFSFHAAKLPPMSERILPERNLYQAALQYCAKQTVIFQCSNISFRFIGSFC